MDQGIATLIAAVLGIIGVIGAAFIGIWLERRRRKERRISDHFGTSIFNWMNLSAEAAKNRILTKFIKVGQTGERLMDLVDSAKKNYSILAICGSKRDYSGAYYETNFRRLKTVKRIFSYEAIQNEIINKCERFALNGLRMHLNDQIARSCDVEAFLIPEGDV